MANETEGLVIGGTILGIVALAGYMFFSPKGPVDDPNVPPIGRETQEQLEAYLPFLDKEDEELGPVKGKYVGSPRNSISKGGKSKKNKSKKYKNKSKSKKNRKVKN